MNTRQKILKNSFLISFFSAFFISGTVFINTITKEKIFYQKEQEKNILLQQVMPLKIYNQFRKKLYTIKDESLGDNKIHNLWLFFKKNRPRAAIVETTAPDGYSGAINMLVAAYFNGKIIGVRVLSHKETPGIGDKIELAISNWITKFSNMYVFSLKDKKFSLKKYGGEIEQFTGATITPQSVTNAVKRTVIFIKKIPLIFNLSKKNIYEHSETFYK